MSKSAPHTGSSETSPSPASSYQRVQLIDAWRGLACLLMLFYHLAYDFVAFGWMSWETYFSLPMQVVERFIAFSFILCAGIGCRFSRNNIRRGFVCALAGLIVVLASFVVEAPILFGILQFLSLAMILYGLFEKWAEKLSGYWFPIFCIILYGICEYWTKSRLVECRWLYWLGFRYEGFISYDFFPVLPYIFLFLLGTWLGGEIQKRREQALFQKSCPAFLCAVGRHTLLIYLAHQPVLYGLCWCVKRFFC